MSSETTLRNRPKTIGEHLREVRKNLGATQDQIAKQMGTYQMRVSQIERGGGSNDEIDRYCAAVQALSKLSKDEFLEDRRQCSAWQTV
jgi:transcriptional regulator with XRE-family HTH domain